MSAFAQFAADIQATGLRHVFGVPGSGNSLSLVNALDDLEVGFHTTLTEGAAAVMAGTLGRLSGVPGAALSIKGPGLANMLPGLAACALESFPVVALTEAYPAGGSPTTVHKAMDHVALVNTIAKRCGTLSAEGSGYSEYAAAAATEVPGPVVLDLLPDAKAAALLQPESWKEPRASGSRLLAASQRPLVIAGTLAIRRGWGAALSALSIPVFTTAAAKGLLDETCPHAAGVYSGVGLELSAEASLLAAADLIVGLGLRAEEVLAFRPFARPALNVDVLAPSQQKIPFDEHLDCAGAVELLDALRGHDWGQEELAESWRAVTQRMSEGGFLPAQTYAAVAGRFGNAVRLVVDTGYFCTVGEHVWRASSPAHWLGSGQSRYMGIATPMALAAALHDPSTPTVLVVGDGGIGMHFGEFQLAVQQRLPLLVLFMSDGGFGSVRTRAIRDHLTQSSLCFPGRSWLRAAEGLGLLARRAESAEQVAAALQAWRPDQGPALLEVRFDPELYQGMVEGVR